MNATTALLEAGISALPVITTDIAEHYNIKVVDYNSFVRIYRHTKPELYRNVSYAGFSTIDDGQYICVLNHDLCGKQRRRWTAAHELGHILCGHINPQSAPTIPQEQEADRFAADILAPLTVLNFCGVSSALELERLCGISAQAAQVRFRELSRLRRMDEERRTEALRRGELPLECLFLQTEESRELFGRFAPFISGYITRRGAHDGYASFLESRSQERMLV